MVIHLGHALPHASCDLPEGIGRATLSPSYAVLLRMGFAKPRRSPSLLVSSYLTLSPLPLPRGRGGLVSVALS